MDYTRLHTYDLICRFEREVLKIASKTAWRIPDDFQYAGWAKPAVYHPLYKELLKRMARGRLIGTRRHRTEYSAFLVAMKSKNWNDIKKHRIEIRWYHHHYLLSGFAQQLVFSSRPMKRYHISHVGYKKRPKINYRANLEAERDEIFARCG